MKETRFDGFGSDTKEKEGATFTLPSLSSYWAEENFRYFLFAFELGAPIRNKYSKAKHEIDFIMT